MTTLPDVQTLAKLLRSRISREERKRHPADGICSSSAPTGVSCTTCWLCDSPLQADIEIVLSLPSARATASTCSRCFLLLYLRFRPSIAEAPFNEFCQKIKRMAEQSQLPTSEASIFVNQRSMRSFVLLSITRENESVECTTGVAPIVAVRTGPSHEDSSDVHSWICEACTLINSSDAGLCSACGRRNPSAVQCPHCQVLLIPCAVARGQDASTRFCNGRKQPMAHYRDLGPPPLLFNEVHSAPSNRSTGILTRVSAHLRPTTTPVRHSLWVCSTCTTINCQATWQCDMCFQWRSIECTKCTFLNTRTNGTILDACDVCSMCGAVLLDNNLVDPRLSTSTDQPPHGALHALGEAQRSREIVQSEQRLKQRIAATDMAKLVQQRGDGNCLFRCIADSLFGTPQLHMVVRHLVVQRLRESAHEYVHYVDDQPWESYVASMSEPGTWGDELCIHAAAAVFQSNITVVSGDESNWLHQFRSSKPTNVTTTTGEPVTHHILLGYTSPVHFDSIVIAALGAPSTDEVLKHVLSSTLALLDEESQWSDVAETDVNERAENSYSKQQTLAAQEWEFIPHTASR